jgi:hypothetical protein
MGIFSQDTTKTYQTAYNQQQGVSNRDVSGTQITGGAGATTGGANALSAGSSSNVGGVAGKVTGNITLNSLDMGALNTAAFTINHALDVNTALSQNLLTGFQNALTVGSEHAPSGDGSGLPAPVSSDGTALSTVQPHHIDAVVWVAIALVGGFIAYNYFKHHK